MRGVWTFLLAAALVSGGCSVDDTFNGGDAGRGGDGAHAGDAAHGGDGSSAQPDAHPPADAHDPTLDPDSACATQTSDTTRAPMNLLIVLDRSGSMQDSGKWTAAVRGLNSLLTTLSDDTRVGLLLFPSDHDSDTEAGYATPTVPVGPLSTTRSMIQTRLANTSPDGGTPMACALSGAVGYYDHMFTMDGSRNIVLITDGEPTEECSGVVCGIFDISCLLMATMNAEIRIQSTVSGAAMETPPVRTFAVGTPDATDSFLTSIAINGGTARSPTCGMDNTCHYSLGASTFEMDLDRALDDIRGRAATCEFQIMIDTTMADPGLINVNYTASPGATPALVPRDRTHMNGWDYSGDMRSVILYGPACDAVLGNQTGGQVQILFGCPTVIPG